MGKQGQIKVTKEDLLQWIKNYHWMVATIEEARKPVAKVDNNSYIGAKIAKYGIEATLPRISGSNSDPVFTEVHRRLYLYNKRIEDFESKVTEVQKRIPYVNGDREVEVLHRLLDGYSIRAIGQHMRLSSTTIFRIRNNILSQMMK